LGLCLITPVIRLSPLVLIAEPQKFSTVLKSAWSAEQRYVSPLFGMTGVANAAVEQ
jgi:hypothetical protein